MNIEHTAQEIDRLESTCQEQLGVLAAQSKTIVDQGKRIKALEILLDVKPLVARRPNIGGTG